MLGEKVGLAGGKELSLLGEVVVDGRSLNARAPGDLGDRRPRGANLFVEARCRRRDPAPRLFLALGVRL